MPKILIVDDDVDIVTLMEFVLQNQGFETLSAHNGKDGVDLALDQKPDLVILDVMMPIMDGIEACNLIKRYSNTPIIMLTAKSGENSIIRGLNIGADDYIVKPCDNKVLVAKVKAILRRQQKTVTTLSHYSDAYLQIDLPAETVFVKGEAVALTGTEFKLLTHLLQNSNRVVPHKELIQKIWHKDDEKSGKRSLKLYILYLRRKLEEDPNNPVYLQTAWGVGYRFHPQNSQETALEASS
jgi:DNA-binding response OmpR family regulator